RHSVVTAERIRLLSPIHVAKRCCIAMVVVLRSLVVGHHDLLGRKVAVHVRLDTFTVPQTVVGLDIADLDFSRDGLTVTLRRSKTDQDGIGRKVGIPYGSNPDTCPVRTLQSWLELAGIASGPVFRSLNRHSQVQPGQLSPSDV